MAAGHILILIKIVDNQGGGMWIQISLFCCNRAFFLFLW